MGTTECLHCGGILPVMDGATRNSSSAGLTGLYDDFVKGCERVRSQEWSLAEFRDWLVAVRAKWESRKEHYIETVRQTDYFYVQEDEVTLCMTGFFEYEDAMDALASFAESGDLAVLDTALADMWEANEKINEALRWNREYRRKLEEEWGYM